MKNLNLVSENGLLYLSPDVRIIEKVGSTGSGKTYGDLLFTTQEAFKVLSLSSGEGSASLGDQTKVYTDRLIDQIVVAAKLSDEIFTWAQLIEVYLKVLTRVVKTYYKDNHIEKSDQMEKELVGGFIEALNSTRNTEAQPRLLSEGQRSEIAMQITAYSLPFLNQKIQTIYYEAKNSLREIEVKPTSRKLDEAINQRLQIAIDLETLLVQRLRATHELINLLLKQHFFGYFSENEISNDDYYYYIIDLKQTEESIDFIEAMFSNNDLSSGKKLSIEVLCSDVVIYAPMNEGTKRLIRSNRDMEIVFQGMDGSLSLGSRDTRGMYHESADQKKEFDYLQELLYDRSYDALMLVCPVFGDNNHSKLREDIKAGLRNYSKQTPIIILNNKVDLLIDDRSKESNQLLDLFELDDFQRTPEISFDEIKAEINERVGSIHREFQLARQKHGSSLLVTIPCYLKQPSTMKITHEIHEAYGPKKALQLILTVLSDALVSSSEKVDFILNSKLESGFPFEINRMKIRELIIEAWNNPQSAKRVQQPALINIKENLGKTPHGRGYNALGYNYLPKGSGWTSNIDQSYFINCQSFSVTFPANLSNFVTSELIGNIIDKAVSYPNGEFKTVEGQNKIKDIVQGSKFRSHIFAANVLFDNAFKEAEKAGFSYYVRFNKFLEICRNYFKEQNTAIEIYTDAFLRELEHALGLAFRLHVYLK